MTTAELQASLALWRRREVDARALWKSRQKRLDQDDPRRVEAFHAYRKANAMRKKRERQVSQLPITHMDAAGRIALIREEGVRRFAYNDSFRSTQYPHGHATFGVGHLIHLGAVTAADAGRWGTPTRPLSMKVVDTVLARDLATYEAAVCDAFRGSSLMLTQAMFNALVSLCFNIGVGGFATSTVVRRLKAGDKTGAADAFLMWSKPPELRGRRTRERAMFLT